VGPLLGIFFYWKGALSVREAFSLKMKRETTLQELASFERAPTVSLISLFQNTGLNRFKMTRALYGNSNKIDTSDEIYKEVIGMLACEAKKDFEVSEWGRIVNQFQRDFNLTADLKSCACCGMRSFEMGSTKYIELVSSKIKFLSSVVNNTLSCIKGNRS